MRIYDITVDIETKNRANLLLPLIIYKKVFDNIYIIGVNGVWLFLIFKKQVWNENEPEISQ